MHLQSDLIKIVLLISITCITGCDRSPQVNEPDDGLAPAIPSGCSIYYSSDGSIGIEWVKNSEGDLKGYNIYKSVNDTLQFRKEGFTSYDYFIDDSLEYETTYFYYITAVDQHNRESKPGSVLSAKPLNRYTPIVPANVSVKARNWNGQTGIYISWDKGRESDISGYKIYKALEQDFTPDSSTFLAFTSAVSFIDTNALHFYERYYYRITAVDKGKLESKGSETVSDLLLEVPGLIFPGQDTSVTYFEHFRIKTVGAPARYVLILQSNPYFGELWRTEFSSTLLNDTIEIPLTYYYLEPNITYYWRAAAYTNDNIEPNSISVQYNFTIKP